MAETKETKIKLYKENELKDFSMSKLRYLASQYGASEELTKKEDLITFVLKMQKRTNGVVKTSAKPAEKKSSSKKESSEEESENEESKSEESGEEESGEEEEKPTKGKKGATKSKAKEEPEEEEESKEEEESAESEEEKESKESEESEEEEKEEEEESKEAESGEEEEESKESEESEEESGEEEASDGEGTEDVGIMERVDALGAELDKLSSVTAKIDANSRANFYVVIGILRKILVTIGKMDPKEADAAIGKLSEGWKAKNKSK